MLKPIAVSLALLLALTAPSQATAASPAKTGAVFQDCPYCPRMAVLPAGSMTMGSTPEESRREGVPPQFQALDWPAHTVTFRKSFAVAQTEITRGQFADYVRDSGVVLKPGCKVRNDQTNMWDDHAELSWKDSGTHQTDRNPVVCVSWPEARAYADWLARKTGRPYRLLSEAEFEYAARGGVAAPRFWGDDRTKACQYANIRDRVTAAKFYGEAMAKDPDGRFDCVDGYDYDSPVATFKPNPYGLYDIIGNAVEWTADCNHDNYDGAPTDGSAWMTGPCTAHVERGGSWIAPPWVARANRRHWTDTDWRFNLMGFRVAEDLK